MLTNDEGKYLQSIPKSKTVKVFPFNPKGSRIANGIILKIKSVFPDLEVKHMGASALRISGQKDLDIYALASPKKFKNY